MTIISQIHSKNRNQLISHIIIFFLLLNIVPISVFFVHTNSTGLSDKTVTLERMTSVPIQRLMKNSVSSSETSQISDLLNPILTPNYAIGGQKGVGAGNYQIYDSLIKVNSTSPNTQNSLVQGNPSERSTTFNIDNSLTNFSRNSLDFFFSNVTAMTDWRSIENETSGTDQLASTTYIEAAQKFEIQEDYANLTAVGAYITYRDLFSGGDYPQGTISIFDDSGGLPGSQLGSKTLESEFGNGTINYGVDVGPTWVEYSFEEPLKVTKGYYWIVLNDTGNQAQGYWNWFGQDDSTNGDTGNWAAKSNHGDSWNLVGFPTIDILSNFNILPTDINGNNLTYSTPEELSMTYNTTDGNYELSSFRFTANNTLTHNLYTNTSVSFSLLSHEDYSFTSHIINPVITFQVHNGSNAFWNLSFSTAGIDTLDIIRNRSVSINGIPSDWNGSSIYWNNSLIPEYTNLSDNVNVTWDGNSAHKYTFGNSTMVINTSSLTSFVEWDICFNTTNYISDFHLERNSLPLSLPLFANVTDTLNLLHSVSEPDGNASLWIEYNPTSKLITNNTNIAYSDNTVSYSWDINSTLDQLTTISGTYDLQVFWINSGKNKVGTYIRKIDLFIPTSLDVQTEAELIIGESLTVSAVYKSLHNATNVKNAKIWCDASWPSATDTYMNQISADLSFNASFDTSGITPGTLENITVKTEMSWFTNWTITVHIKFVENSTLSLDPSNLVLEWQNNISLKIDYRSIDETSISGAIVQVNDSYANYNTSISAYIYKLNTTDFPGIGFYPNIPVMVNHSDYLSRELNFSLTIIPGTTNITGYINGEFCLNNSEIFMPFANGSADNLNLNLQYFYSHTQNNLLSNEPLIESLVPHVSSVRETNSSWTLKFNPSQSGRFVINITFTLLNYRPALFIVNLNIEKALTQIQINSMSPIAVYYSNSAVFSAFFINADWNENITLSESGSIEIENDTHLEFLNRTGEYYWFRFSANQLTLGSHTIDITFSCLNFELCTESIVFTIVEMPTLRISDSNVHFSNNSSVMVEDSLGVSIGEYLTIDNISIDSLDNINLWLNGTPVLETSISNLQLSHTPFIFNLSTLEWQYGLYNLTIQVQKYGFQTQYYSHSIRILGLPVNLLVEIEPGKNIRQGEDIIFSSTLIYPGGIASEFSLDYMSQFSLNGVEISYYIVLKYQNESTLIFRETIPINELGQAQYTISGLYTIDAVGFSNVTITSSAGMSTLPASYVMTASELADFEIIPPAINIIDVITEVLILVAFILVTVFVSVTAIRTYRRKRTFHKSQVLINDRLIEESYEDIKSIRLVLIRHNSGLPIYVEKTIAEFSADTDALSGMSTAISQFIEDVSVNMVSRNANGSPKEKFESISREGFHMLIWNGHYSSILLISEKPLAEYFMERLYGLGKELEEKFKVQLNDLIDLDQFPQAEIKKMVRKYLSIHHFSAFVLNEGILTLKNIKLSKKDKKMVSLIKKSAFEKHGLQYFFSEQVISLLATKCKRSEAINFLEKAIKFNLLVECSQEELKQLGQ